MTETDTYTKSDLRQRFRTARSRLSDEAYARKSADIIRQVERLPELQQAGTVHVYWPMVSDREVDTRPLIRNLHQRGVQVVLPVVTRFVQGAGDTPVMEHCRYTGPDCLQTNRWGVYEPRNTPLISAEAFDLVIVPALGAGRNGHRIGHGYGYYDAFLSAVTVPTVALVYAECLVDAVPVEAHDVPLTYIATEHELIRTGTA